MSVYFNQLRPTIWFINTWLYRNCIFNPIWAPEASKYTLSSLETDIKWTSTIYGTKQTVYLLTLATSIYDITHQTYTRATLYHASDLTRNTLARTNHWHNQIAHDLNHWNHQTVRNKTFTIEHACASLRSNLKLRALAWKKMNFNLFVCFSPFPEAMIIYPVKTRSSSDIHPTFGTEPNS